MIEWNSAETDFKVDNLDNLFEKFGYFTSINIILHCLNNPFISIINKCYTDIENYLAQSKNELGGLLLGKTFKVSFNTSHGYKFITIVTVAIPSLTFKNSPVSLQMGTEIWNEARTYIDKGLSVLGWYHSHPNLGAFFSATDRATQKAFFNYPYSIGLVIDPIRKENKCFYGADSIEIDTKVKIIPDNIEGLIVN
jgi:proteasome lid subunit RPN8/RPN11